MADQRAPFSTHNFTVVVVRNFDGRWLAVKETRKRGWWLPAGLVDPGETYMQAAHRETLNEAAIRVEIKGILRVEHSVYGPTHARMRVVMYAEPIDNEQVPKRGK
jgi:phosphatase NudJ